MSVKINDEVFRKVERDVIARGEYLKRGAAATLSYSISVGKRALQEGLLAAETRTGQARAELAGGHPGRYVTGRLVDGVESFAPSVLDSADGEGWFGWTPDAEAFDYAEEQDAGTDMIPPANALPQAQVIAIEEFRDRIRDFGFVRKGAA